LSQKSSYPASSTTVSFRRHKSYSRASALTSQKIFSGRGQKKRIVPNARTRDVLPTEN
jgi:hypothetical protein